MKNVLKICLVLILALSVVFALTACGGEEETTTTADNGGNADGPNGPNVPNDENFNGGGNQGGGTTDPLPEGDDLSDPAGSDIFE